MEKIINALARELNIKPKQAEAAVQLLDEAIPSPSSPVTARKQPVLWTKNKSVLSKNAWRTCAI